MRFLFEMCINALEVLMILDFLARYLGYREQPKPQRYRRFFLMWLISFGTLAVCSWNIAYEGWSAILQIIINVLFCCWLLQGSLAAKLFLSVFVITGNMLIVSITALIFGWFSEGQLMMLYQEFNMLRMIAVLTSKVAFFSATRIVLRLRQNTRLSWQDALVLIIMPLFSLAAAILLTDIAIHVPDMQRLLFSVVCIISLLTVLTYYLFVRISRGNQLRTEYELLNLQFACAQANFKDIQSLYQRIRALNHDMKNHLLCIDAFIQQDNATQARQYIHRLLQQQESRSFVNSGNTILDAIISIKFSQAMQEGISCTALITEKLTQIAPEDLCVLFGNLLDNAITAAKNCTTPSITVRIERMGKDSMIVVTNSIDAPVLKTNPQLQTTKTQQGHGLGVKNICYIVKKHRGYIHFSDEKGIFECTIILQSC